MKILIPIDGSPSASRALNHAIELANQCKQSPELHLLNVQWNLASGNVKLFINQETINQHYREQGLTALAPARERLEAANLGYVYHISIGSPAEAIAQYAQEHDIDQIIMGRQGQGSLSALLLGSVSNKLLHLTEVPILLIK